jgi:hypothetical protein
MRCSKLVFVFVIVLTSQLLGQADGVRFGPNVLANGGLEDRFVNDIEQLPSYQSRIYPLGRSYVPHWVLSDGAKASEICPHTGVRCLELASGEKPVTAELESDFWKVWDPAMPFGLPLVPGKDIYVSFFYRTSGELNERALKCQITLGTIPGLPSRTEEYVLAPAMEWRRHEIALDMPDWKWGASVRFVLPPLQGTGIKVWIDDVELRQEVGGENLVSNSEFETLDPEGRWPIGWEVPSEDQWVSWVGASYRRPEIEENESVSGARCVRASVTYTEGSGLSQRIRLHQKEAKPVVLSVWSKLDNSIGNSPPGYWGPDNLANLTVFVYFTDGTMQEVSPTFSLGVSDHDWDYRRFGFNPPRPIEEMQLRFTVLGSEPTTTLFLDEVEAWEWGATREDLIRRGVNVPAKCVVSSWGNLEVGTRRNSVLSANDDTSLSVFIPGAQACPETRIYLNPQVKSDFLNHYRFLYHVLRISASGKSELGEVVEKQGFTAEGLFVNAEQLGIDVAAEHGGWLVRVPFQALGTKGDASEPFGLNIVWKTDATERLWTGRTFGTRDMGRIILARKPSLRLKSLMFGRRYFEEPDQSQDFISQPQVYAGNNSGEAVLVNEAESGCKVDLTAGVRGEKAYRQSVSLEPGEIKTVALPYDAGGEKAGFFDLKMRTNDGVQFARSYPILIPPGMEVVLDQEFYYPEEKEAVVEVYNRRRPIPKGGRVTFAVRDLAEQKVVLQSAQAFDQGFGKIHIDIQKTRINPLPVQDYELTLIYQGSDDQVLGRASTAFGRIRHTERRPLPPIHSLRLDDQGRLIINGNFRFFPIIPSVNVMDWDEAINMGANVYRSSYAVDGPQFKDTERAWAKNAYTVTIGPDVNPHILENFQKEATRLLAHPGFLACYGKQFYYWKLSKELVEYRKRVEDVVAGLPNPRLVIWGHHDSSFLYDRGGPSWARNDLPVGYCYVKIMGRPGSMWRNIPFLTKTERVLDPHRFLLAEVNYYASFHCDEVVPEQYPGYLSLRGDDWRGIRAESYLGVIYGANGLYHWICTQQHQIQRLRGWFQELNFMWPIFVSNDAQEKVEVSPLGSQIDVRLKRWNDKNYLLTANAGEASQEAEISIRGWKTIKATKLFEIPGSLVLEKNTIKDRWEKYGVHVYEITR